jgi:hypothetical protein
MTSPAEAQRDENVFEFPPHNVKGRQEVKGNFGEWVEVRIITKRVI